MPVVLIPTAYRAPTRGEAEVEASGATVRDCLQSVEDQYPGFLEMVVDAGGNVHRFVKLFLNEEQLDPKKALDQEVAESDRVEVLAAIAGG